MQNISNSEKRIFIGIGITESIRRKIYDLAVKLLGNEENTRIIPSSNIHLTMKFLGNTKIQKIHKIEKAIKNSADNFNKFEFEITREIGAFPSLGNARVVFLKIGSGADVFIQIYDSLKDNLSRIKIRKEKRNFSPHLTIARIKDRRNLDGLLEGKTGGPYKLKCPSITLFESKLKPAGAEHTILGEFSLK